MPYVGKRNSEFVSPLDVRDNETVICPECGGHLGVREGHYNRGKLIARHFFHKNGGDCGGESDIHRRMKTVACYKLQQVFPFADVDDEIQIGDRFADSGAIFPEPIKPFGKGLLVEAQHKNKGKNIGQVSQEYLEHGYSVFWAYQSDFDDHEMEFAPHRARTVWPDALPDRSGLEGYSETIRKLWTGEFRESKTLEISLPHDFWKMHRLELISPVQGNVEHDWEVLDEHWIHPEGRRLAWVTMYRAPQDKQGLFVEFWTKDRKTNSVRHIPVRWTFDDLQAFGDILTGVKQYAESTQSDPPRSSVLARARLTGTRKTVGQLSAYVDDYERPALQYGRRDAKGNTRSLKISLSSGDIDRLQDLGEQLSRLFETNVSRA